MTRRATHILVVDDDDIIRSSMTEFLRLEGFAVESAGHFDEVMSAVSRTTHDAIILDVNLPGPDGFELLSVLKKRFPDTAVIMMTGYGTIESAVEAIKMGAYDYLTKPIIDDELRLVLKRALEQQSLLRRCQNLQNQLEERFSLGAMIGHDYKMLRVFDLIEAVADSKVNVLIDGESGTGKSLLARVIHQRSDRRDQAFVEVSCGALPESLLESELFGHVKGAFTGAVADKQGKFKAADGGTLFLDEIAMASPALQVKLLRVLQEREFEPVGSNQTVKVDVRLIMATNVVLEAEVEAGRFRQDLYYRVNVVNISLPQLRERIGDIPLLASRFLKRYAEQTGKHVQGIADDALATMQRYHWPGNVRELENLVERAVVLTRSIRIGIDDLPPKLIAIAESPADVGEYHGQTLKEALSEPERRIIESALRRNGWCRQATADQLDINRTTLYKKMKHYGLDRASEIAVGLPC